MNDELPAPCAAARKFSRFRACLAAAGLICLAATPARAGFIVTATTAGVEPNAIATGDFNNDGNADLVTANGNGTVNVLLGAGNGGFAAPLSVQMTNAGLYGIAAGDLNSDGGHRELPGRHDIQVDLGGGESRHQKRG